jgi:hypothetical protein
VSDSTQDTGVVHARDSGSGRQGGARRSYRLVLLAVGVGILVAAGLLAPLAHRPVTQPIAFSHKLHAGDLALDCTECHRYVLTGARATIPNVEVCGECHVEALGESAEEKKLITFVESGEPIPWRKIYRVPDHVYFSHRRHAAIGGIACERCHGPMAERTLPVTEPAVRLTMDACIECHDQSGVTHDCITCHR